MLFRERTMKDEFTDVGWSGKDDNRPGLRNLEISIQDFTSEGDRVS
jgi:hypothetical protein